MNEWKIGDLVWSKALRAFGIVLDIDHERYEARAVGAAHGQLKITWYFEPGRTFWCGIRPKNDIELMQD